MAAETLSHADVGLIDYPIKLLGGFQRYSGDLGVHFSEAGDKYRFGILPKYGRPMFLSIGVKGFDINATATGDIKVQFTKVSAATELVVIATFALSNSGAFQLVTPDSEDFFGQLTDEDAYLEIEVVNAPATAATAAECWSSFGYIMEYTD